MCVINNAAWGGVDHPLNYMILFKNVNNSVEFRVGPSHLKMIMLGKPTFATIQRFSKWYSDRKFASTVPGTFVQIDHTKLIGLTSTARQTTLDRVFVGEKRKR